LVAIVVPWNSKPTFPGATPSAASASTTRSKASPGSAGVDGTLATLMSPSEEIATASV
jgi:hypothetical protein